MTLVNTEFLRFVGGPEDGKYIEVVEGVGHYEVYEKIKPNVTPNYGTAPNNELAKILLYVRQGNEMVFNS